MKNGLCLNPWNYLCIEAGGDCYFCCSAVSVDKHIIGNILENSFDEIWNGEKAKAFREDVYNKKYTHCDIKRCYNIYDRFFDLYSVKDDVAEKTNYSVPLPSIVQFNYDYTCGQRCIFCRDGFCALTPQEQEKWNEIIDSKLIPLLANTKLIMINGVGEIFDSKHSQELLKKINSTYPNVKYEIFSNGVRFDEENIEKLGLTGKIKQVTLSVHAATVQTYKKIFRVNNFEKVRKNISYLSCLKKEGKIEDVTLNFAINSLNFREMKQFVQYATELDINVSFFTANNTNNTKFTKDDRIFAVYKPTHHLYNEFVDLIQDEIFKSPNCFMDFDTKLKKVSFVQVIKNYLALLTIK